jgi:hypothetical protein
MKRKAKPVIAIVQIGQNNRLWVFPVPGNLEFSFYHVCGHQRGTNVPKKIFIEPV